MVIRDTDAEEMGRGRVRGTETWPHKTRRMDRDSGRYREGLDGWAREEGSLDDTPRKPGGGRFQMRADAPAKLCREGKTKT